MYLNNENAVDEAQVEKRENDRIVINLSPQPALSQDLSNERLGTKTRKKLQEFGEAFQDMKLAFCPNRVNSQCL